jgi:AraC-like DNA-binding protein
MTAAGHSRDPSDVSRLQDPGDTVVPLNISATQSYRIRSLAIDAPALMLVLEGTKRLTLRDTRWTCRQGEYLMVHRPELVDLENIPDRSSGRYRALGAYFSWHVVEIARTLLAVHHPVVTARGAPSISTGQTETLDPVLGALLGLKPRAGGVPDPVEFDHALVGILIALARQEQGHFLQAGDPSLSARVRLLIEADPAREWVSAHVEEELHVSGATLRRHLAEEGTSLRQLIREARLHKGLTLLQTTRRSVKAVAYECGYRSVPSFVRGFVDRFGVKPARVMSG